MRIWKERIGFTLKKKDYNDTIARLKSANTFLHNLVKDCRVLGTSRRRQSRTHVIRLLRNLAKSLFDALKSAAASCCCPQPHKAYLELVVRDLAFIRNLDTEDRLAKEVPFHVVLTSMVMEKTLPEPEKIPLLPSRVRWTSFRLQCEDFALLSPTPTVATSSTLSLASSGTTLQASGTASEKHSTQIAYDYGPAPPDTKSKLLSFLKGPSMSSRHRKTVSFASGSATQTLVHVSTTTLQVPGTSLHSPRAGSQPYPASIPTSDPLLDLCQVTLNKGKKPASDKDHDCHGWIMDVAKGRRFGLYPPRWDPQDDPSAPHTQTSMSRGTSVQPQTDSSFEVRTSFTLRQVLLLGEHTNHQATETPTSSGLPSLDFCTKLRMAQAISAGILQLHGTPWMTSAVLTLDDIMLRLEDGRSDTSPALSCDDQSEFPYRPFVNKSFPYSNPSSAQKAKGVGSRNSRPMEMTVFSLGVILIQIMLGRVIDELEIKNTESNGKDHNADTTTETTTIFTTAPTPTTTIKTTITTTATDTTKAMNDTWAKLAHGEAINNAAVLQEAGEEYSSAVSWCLKSCNKTTGLDHDKFCQEFCVNVVATLQEALDNSSGRSRTESQRYKNPFEPWSEF